MRRIGLVFALVLSLGSGSAFAGEPGVGDSAPEVKPNQWLNNTSPMGWEELTGRVILVEKWATW